MGVWCIQTAKALRLLGYRVIVIKSYDFCWKEGVDFEFFTFPPRDEHNVVKHSKSIFHSFRQFFLPGFDRGDGFIPSLLPYLHNAGIEPTHFLFSMPQLCNPSSGIPQAAVNWMFPVSWGTTISRIPYITYRPLGVWYQLLGFYRFKSLFEKVPTFISLTQRMQEYLVRKGYRSFLLPPGVEPLDCIPLLSSIERTVTSVRFLVIAHNLEQRRKGVVFTARALALLNSQDFSISYLGKASEKFKQHIRSFVPQAEFLPPSNRNDALRQMCQHDVLIFSSVFEDWGFVQQEAMAAGMLLLAPDISPSDEIVPDRNYLFAAKSTSSLAKKVQFILALDKNQLEVEKERFKKHFEMKHSLQSYARRLQALLEEL